MAALGWLLNLESAPGAYSITAETGSYTYSGVASNLVVGRNLAAAVGSYSLSGIATNFVYTRTLTAAAGSYTLTGIANSFSRTYTIAADTGSYTYTGIDSALTYSGASATGINIDGAASQIISTNYASLTLYMARGNYYTID